MSRQYTSFNKLVAASKAGDLPPIQKIQESPVLNAFTRALSNALDESSDHHVAGSRSRKNKAWKCQLKSKSGSNLSNGIPKSTNKSDSESSLDSWIHQQIDITRKVNNKHTDSDNVNKAYCGFADWRQCGNNIGESDSVPESAHHSREPRRKRKFKRMAIDPPAIKNHTYSQKSKRNRNQKLSRSSKVPVKYNKLSKLPASQLSTKTKNMHSHFPTMSTACGKRKRCNDEKSSECSGYECKEFIADERVFDSTHSFPECGVANNSVEFTTSEISSSECELSANDESREADDEQSDFFCDSGSSHSILNSDAEDDDNDDDEEDDETAGYCQLMEIRFDVIPAFRGLYEIRRKQMYEALKKRIEENGQNVKSGQRRLLKAYQSSFTNDELLHEKPMKDEW